MLINVYSMLDNEDFLSLVNVCLVMNDMESVEEYDFEYCEILSFLFEIYYVLEDISKCLEVIIEDFDFDGNCFMQVENCLDFFYIIMCKYGGIVDDVLFYFVKIMEEYNFLIGNNFLFEDMEIEFKKLEVNFVDLVGQFVFVCYDLVQQLEVEIK